jgi:hypothetical protein
METKCSVVSGQWSAFALRTDREDISVLRIEDSALGTGQTRAQKVARHSDVETVARSCPLKTRHWNVELRSRADFLRSHLRTEN